MSYNELAKLDKKIIEAHANLVSLNSEYNDLLTAIYQDKNKVSTVFASERERKLVSKRQKLAVVYWVVFIADMLANSFFGLPSNIYGGIFVTNAIIYIVGSAIYGSKIRKEIARNKVKSCDQNVNKDELYEKLCQARELYHSLRKKREEVFIEEDDLEYQKYLKQVDIMIANNESNKEVLEEKEESQTLKLNKNW